MTGVSIDHMVALTVFLAVLLMSFGVYGQILSAAVEYQRNNQVAMKAADLTDNMLLSPGSPPGWGHNNSDPTAFGLQDPETRGLTLSPFAPQRLIYPESTITFELFGSFNNVSMERGASLFLPVAEYVDYATVATSLGVNGSYGFQVTIMPTLRVSVSENKSNPLRFKIEVRGPGLSLGGSSVNGDLYYVDKGDPTLSINVLSNTTETDSTGSARLTFSDIDASQVAAYAVLVHAHLSGLAGVGFYSPHNEHLLIPLITDYEQGNVTLVHDCEGSAVDYNMAFLLRTQNFGFRFLEVDNKNGTVNPSQSKEVGSIMKDVGSGILLIAYTKEGSLENTGIVMVPWGISALGIPITFGGDPCVGSWVATELRQVTINSISYQVKLAAWSVEGYQV